MNWKYQNGIFISTNDLLKIDNQQNDIWFEKHFCYEDYSKSALL